MNNPLSSENDKWTGNPEMDRAMLVARSMQALHGTNISTRQAEINAKQDRRALCRLSIITAGCVGLLITLILFIEFIA